MGPVDKLLSDEHSFRVTGVMIQYATICERELWLEDRGIQINRDNPHIVQGTNVDESAYSYLERSQLNLGPIAPDLLQNGKIVEIKPSRANETAARNQLLYYLWYLKKEYGIEKDGVLAYPEQRERENIQLDEEATEQVEELIQRIYKVVSRDTPPKFERKPVCKSCAFQDFCMAGNKEVNK